MPAVSRSRWVLFLALLLSVVGWPRPAWATFKLMMKDGSYQLVSSYEVHGDRVRYYSTERSAWEEIPSSMVDLDATQRAQDETKAEQKKQIEQAKEIEQERFYKPPDTGLEVAPGLHLPGDDGIFTVDGRRVVRLAQSAGETITDKKRTALVLAIPLPVVKTRSLVILEGAKATIRLNDDSPLFYVQSADGLATRLQLVRLKPGANQTRVVEDMESGRTKGSTPTEERTVVALERKQVAPKIYTLKPARPLEAGEYALGELIGEKLNLDVWDFGLEKWEVVK